MSARRSNPGAAALLGLFRGWQLYRSGKPSPCRFAPTCSEYGIDAVHAHGALRGGWLTIRRLSRCRPFGRSGWDPVPERQPMMHGGMG